MPRHIPLWWFPRQCVRLSVFVHAGAQAESWLRAVHLALWLFLFRAFPCVACAMILVDSNHSFFLVSISHNWAWVPEGQVYKIRTSLHNRENISLMWKKGCVASLTIEGVDWFKAGEPWLRSRLETSAQVVRNQERYWSNVWVWHAEKSKEEGNKVWIKHLGRKQLDVWEQQTLNVPFFGWSWTRQD